MDGPSHISTQTVSCASTHSTDHTDPESEVRPVAPDVISVIRSICFYCTEGRDLWLPSQWWVLDACVFNTMISL